MNSYYQKLNSPVGGKSGKSTGYASGLDNKRYLLKLEEVPI